MQSLEVSNFIGILFTYSKFRDFLHILNLFQIDIRLKKRHTANNAKRKGEIIMSLSTIIFIVGLLGAILGVKKPWMGGVTGLLIAPSLFYFSISSNIIPLVIITLICSLFGLACSFASSILFSGLKGKGHKAGTTYVSGFGVHHPGGIILSNGERKVLKDKNLKREVVISY
jgi:hypothetical protein